ncbi:MAG: EF-hand domain-containing protein [Leptospirales bacterium]|nr:EF-hand domain-containing protein [Leptospirales bacterium]
MKSGMVVFTSILTLYAAAALNGQPASHPPQGGDCSMSGPPADGAHGAMARMDANGDGMISRAEFDAFHAMMFGKIDANGDGQLSREEMQQHMQHMHEMHGGH